MSWSAPPGRAWSSIRLTGEPTEWNLLEPASVTWYQQATAYAVMKWPSLAAHSRASMADALATVRPH